MQDSDAPARPRVEALHTGSSGIAAFIGILAAFALGGLAVLSRGSSEPLVLTLLAALAMVGVFFLFGLAAGLFRLGDRGGEAEIMRGLSDAHAQAMLVTTGDGYVVFANGTSRRLLNLPVSGAVPGIEEAFSGEPQALEAIFRLARAAEKGETRTEEFHVRGQRLDGARHTRVFRIAVSPYAGRLAEEHAGPLIVWDIADVTSDRMRHQEALSGLQETIASYDSLPVGLFKTGADGRIELMNARLADWLGLGGQGAAARRPALSDIVAAEGITLLRGMPRSEGSPIRLDVDLLREAGGRLPVRLVFQPDAGATTDQLAGRGLVLSRAAGSTVNEDTRAAEIRFARFFQSSPFGIATVDRDGRIVAANAAFVRMFSSRGGGVGGTLADLMSRESDEATARAIEGALKLVLTGRAGVAPVEASFGPDRSATRRIYMSPVADGEDIAEQAILYVIDATEQKSLEIKFAQSQKMEAVGQLAGGIAHDFNNVLTAIIGFSDLLLQTHRPSDPAYKDIMNIKQNANRAAGLVRQLLAFSRRQTLMPEVLHLNEVLTDLSVLINRLIGEKIDLKIVSGRDLWSVKADKTQFEQVIINLAVNARDAMTDGGRLTVRTRNVTERDSLKLAHLGIAAGEYVLVEVEDTGTGMTAEVMGKIFEPFFSTKEVGKGTGLGLATVYGIVKQTGGYVFPESAVGKGTTFRVYLPRLSAEAEAEEEVQIQARNPKKERAGDLTGTGRVLLVEDEDAVRNFAVRALQRQGYQVLEAATGIEALEIMEAEGGRVDIVVSDVVMPEMDGPTLLKELRKRNPTLKIIFVSGYPDEAFKKSLDENEEFAFLPKPFTLPQLAAKVKEQIGR